MEKVKKKWKWILTTAIGLRLLLPMSTEAIPIATDSMAAPDKSPSFSLLETMSTVAAKSFRFVEEKEYVGDLWEDWGGAMDFPGDGSKEIPFQISTISQLMGLSESVASGQSYKDTYFELTNDIDLGGLSINSGSWNPIGWYRSGEEMKSGNPNSFQGVFDGNGNTIYGLKILNPGKPLKNIGLFGVIDGGVVKHLKVQADDICGLDCIGVLAGTILGDSTIYDVTVSGFLFAEDESEGHAGGIAGMTDGQTGRVIVENCTADGIVIQSLGENGYVGGISGKTRRADLVDNTAYTQDGASNRIQGKGYVGGIAGNMDHVNVYNSYVDGTIGGNGSRAVGGIVGLYESGNLVLARFAGDISRTNQGASACEGTFLGTRHSRAAFTYGTEKNDNFSYLFTNTPGKAKVVFGSRIDGDNSYSKSAHIGYWTDNETRYSIVSGATETGSRDQYFYEELEEGVRSVITRKLGNEYTAQGAAKDLRFRLDHFAPGYQGEPVTGYLLSVPRIDAKNANGTYDTDVALLTALPNGNQSFYRTIDKDHGGAVAPGIAVTVVTAPKNKGDHRYQMVVDENEEGMAKPPTYIDEEGQQISMNYMSGGGYTFLMPGRDTEINVQYQKVTTRLNVSPEETEIFVVHTRSGDRKKPETRTEVRNSQGKLIDRYINGAPDASIEVHPISIHGEHNGYGDTADRTMKWSVDDSDLLELTVPEGYTTDDARVLPNLTGSFIQEILHREIQIQADNQYQEIIQPTIYEKSAVVTAMTNPKSSLDKHPVYGNAKVTVQFQILDQTTRRVEGLSLNQSNLTFTVTRKLTGDRKAPEESISCTEPVVLSAMLFPQQPFYKNVTWKDQESQQIITLSPAGEHGENVSVGIRYDSEGKACPAWIQNIINQDNQKKKEDPYKKLDGSAMYTETITATSEDRTHGLVSSECHVTICFVTQDETVIHPENIQIDKQKISRDLSLTKAGDSQSKTIKELGFEPITLKCSLSPECTPEESYSPYDREILWSVSEPDVLEITQDGLVTPRKDALWIKEALKHPPYKASKTVQVFAVAKDNGISDTAEITLNLQTDCIQFSQKDVIFDLVLTKTGKRSNPTFTWSGNGEKQNLAFSYPEKKTITYQSSNPELVAVSQTGVITFVLDPNAEWTKKTATVYATDERGTDTCNVILNLKVVDRTTSASSGGKGSYVGTTGPGKGTGGSSVGTTLAGSGHSAAPKGSVTGDWTQGTDKRWKFSSGTQGYQNQWAYVYNPYADPEKGQNRADWFRFDQEGYMMTGWYTDTDNNQYYLSPISDNTMGHMVTGWYWIPGADGKKRCYYFNPVSDGTKGALFRGKNTPDGYLVNEDGAWIENGVVVLR